MRAVELGNSPEKVRLEMPHLLTVQLATVYVIPLFCWQAESGFVWQENVLAEIGWTTAIGVGLMWQKISGPKKSRYSEAGARLISKTIFYRRGRF